MGPEFFQTSMGKKYYESTLPRIAKALEHIAGLSKQIEPEKKEQPMEVSLNKYTFADIPAVAKKLFSCPQCSRYTLDIDCNYCSHCGVRVIFPGE